MKIKEIRANDYPIFVSSDLKLLSKKFSLLCKKKYSKFVILCDENTQKYCLKSFISSIDALSNASVISINSGEKYKNINTCKTIWNRLLQLKADRSTLLINLGGGVICDIGGFAASTYKRGIDFVQIPTTLLAQVDASIGGKTGIDLNEIKNAIGLFASPKFVLICSDFLKTLAKKQILSGWAEVIKHYLIADSAGWKKIKSQPIKISSEIILHSLSIKNKIVLIDYRESNERKSLNYGHTIGHALESFFIKNKKNPMLHGEAIAIGMLCEAYLSVKYCKLPQEQFIDIEKYVLQNFPYFEIKSNAFETLLNFMRNDKKNSGSDIHFSLLSEIGKCKTDCIVSEKHILESLEYYRNLR